MVPGMSRRLRNERSGALFRSAREPAVVNDEPRSFERLVMPHLADALALARWLTRNPADAEDVLQEACLRAFRSLHTCVGNNPRAWVLTILRNTAYSWLEKNRRTDMVAIDDLEARERDVLENGASTSIDWHVPTPEAELI